MILFEFTLLSDVCLGLFIVLLFSLILIVLRILDLQ